MGFNLSESVENSILFSVKKIIGVEPDDISFDSDIIMDTNSALMTAFQLGVGSAPFTIAGGTETWSDWLGEDLPNIGTIRTYIGLKVRLMFDPPTSSIVKEALVENIKEMESRLIYQCDN